MTQTILLLELMTPPLIGWVAQWQSILHVSRKSWVPFLFLHLHVLQRLAALSLRANTQRLGNNSSCPSIYYPVQSYFIQLWHMSGLGV